MNEKRNDMWLKSCIEISECHSRLDMHRFDRTLENNSNELGRELTDEEIQEFKDRFEDELYRVMFTRAGK